MTTSQRHSGRAPDELREISFQPGIAPHASGSVLVSFGRTQVICAASIEEGVPRWMKEQNVTGGWLTAEYSMLPYSTMPRKPRAFGVHLRYEDFCLTPKVMGSLMGTEVKFARRFGREGVGKSLIPIFFPLPGQLRRSEQRWWDLTLDDKETLFNQGFWSKKEEEEQIVMLDELRCTDHDVRD